MKSIIICEHFCFYFGNNIHLMLCFNQFIHQLYSFSFSYFNIILLSTQADRLERQNVWNHGIQMQLIENKSHDFFYLVIGPGDSVNALNDERIWLWKEPIQDADFFMPSVGVVVFGEARATSSSFILMMTWADLDLGLSWSSNLVHARSRDDRSVAILSGFTVISSQTYLKQKRREHKKYNT